MRPPLDARTLRRREFLAWGAGLTAAGTGLAPPVRPRVAGITTVYHHNSHADVILGRLLEGYTLDGRGEFPSIALASLYLDQRPANDKGARLAREHNVPLLGTAAEAVTLGTGRLAVDGVLLVLELGRYPRSPIGGTMYPKRRLFAEVVEVFRRSGRSVPIFMDKQLSDSRADIAWIDRTARELGVPMMAGSVLPVARRDPPVDVGPGEPLAEVLALSYHTLDAYGFHALEIVQCLAERRRGGETGVRAVRSTTGAAVWKALQAGAVARPLLVEALAKSPDRRLTIDELPVKVPEPVLWQIDYADGLRGAVLTLNGAVGAWSAAWRTGDGRVHATGFDTREVRPLMHFSYQVQGIEAMIRTGRPAWPVERTLLTSGLQEALLTSGAEGGRRVETPHLAVAYRSDWSWRQPPPYPPPRPLTGQ
ncbi:MAG: hypothetical protein ACLQGP_30160 [Isosphaeraceae bacterium]